MPVFTANTTTGASNVSITFTTLGWPGEPPAPAGQPARPPKPSGAPPVLAAALAPDGTWEIPARHSTALALRETA